jgi:hypothetical protein
MLVLWCPEQRMTHRGGSKNIQRARTLQYVITNPRHLKIAICLVEFPTAGICWTSVGTWLHQHLVLSVTFIFPILVDLYGYLVLGFICISLVTNEDKYFFTFLGHLCAYMYMCVYILGRVCSNFQHMSLLICLPCCQVIIYIFWLGVFYKISNLKVFFFGTLVLLLLF